MIRLAFRRAHSRLPWALLAFFSFLSVAASPAAAQSGSALSQYHRGERLYEEGDLTGALTAFRNAYALDPRAHRGERIGMHFEDYDPAFQIGRIQARLGNFEEAQRFFSQAAAGGYTERSRNAEEFRRWRSVVERAVAARARPTEAPLRPEPAQTRGPSTATPAVETPPPPATPSPLIAAAARSSTPRATRTPLATRPPLLEAISPTAPPLIAVVSTPAPSPSRLPEPSVTAAGVVPAGPPPKLLFTLLLAAAIVLALLISLVRRSRRPRPVGEGVVPFGRFAITGLLGTGRHSFVYEARDGKRAAIALRVRRPDRTASETERFAREAAALERTRRREDDVPALRLLARGLQKTPGGPVEYLALERLSGTSLLDLSRSARRRIDPTLSVEILHEVAAALRRLGTLGLINDEVAAEDVFLVHPVPVNSGHPIHLKILGLCLGPPDSRQYAAALADIAAELFRGRGLTSDHDEWLADHVPAGLARVLTAARASEGVSGASFEDVEKALRETTGSHRGP